MAWPIKNEELETVLDQVCISLTLQLRTNPPRNAEEFQDLVKHELETRLTALTGSPVVIPSKAQQFPDLPVPPYGVEVKFVVEDSWRSVANSISEGSRIEGVEQIYVVYGKLGGTPEVRWRRYDDCVVHVRTSHRPRFEIDIEATDSLFRFWGIPYDDFRKLSTEDQMAYIRQYARSRLKEGEKLWWLESEDSEKNPHTLDIGVRLYRHLPEDEKRKVRAEAALLNPGIVGSARSKSKYDGVAMYLLTYRGILANHLRDLYSAGSVALRRDTTRGGIYIQRGLLDIQDEMRRAAKYLENKLFQEYWGYSVPEEDRLKEWLRQADAAATGWVPSEVLFVDLNEDDEPESV